MATTSEKRRPLSLQINGYGTVKSREHFTKDEAEDIIRMMVEVVDTVAESPDDVRLVPRGLEVTSTNYSRSYVC